MKNVRLLGIILSVLSLSQAFADVKTVRIYGGAAPINNIFNVMKADFEAKNPNIKLDIHEESPELALARLAKGETEIAAAGLAFEDWIKLCKEKGNELKADAFRSQVVGRDLVGVFANKDVSVDSLQKDQLKGLFTGASADWSAVGGKAGAVTLVVGTKIAGTNKVFQKIITDGAEFKGKVESVGTTDEIMAKISATPGSVGIGPAGAKIAGLNIKVLRSPEVGRPITAALKGEPSEEIKKVLDFAKTIK